MVRGRRYDEKHWRAHIFGILSPGADEPSVRDKAKVNMYQTTKTHILNLISGLAQIIAIFINLNVFIFADYLESDVSSTLYQQVDLVSSAEDSLGFSG